MQRMLLYSLEHLRLIRIIWMDEGGTLRQGNIQVTALSEESVTFQLMRPRRTLTIPTAAILSADFRKGDEGDG